MSDANIYSHQVDQLHSMSNETMLNEREPFQDPRINFAEVDRHIVVVPTSLESNHDYLYKDLPQINTDIATGVETNPNTFEFKNEPKKGPLQSIKSLLQAARNKKKGNRKRETRDSRNCCCRKRVLIPLIVLALIIITLAVLAYLIFPSAPSVEVTDPVPEPSGFLVNGQPISAIGGTIAQQPTIELSIAMGTQVTYSSSSYITLGLRKVEVSVISILS